MSLYQSLYVCLCVTLCACPCVIISRCVHLSVAVCTCVHLCDNLYGVYISPLLCAHVCMSMSLCACRRFVQRCVHHQVAHDAHLMKALKMKMQTPLHQDQMCMLIDLMMHCVHLELNMHTPISYGLATVTSID